MPRPSARVTAAVAVLVLGLAGCGSRDSSASSAGQADQAAPAAGQPALDAGGAAAGENVGGENVGGEAAAAPSPADGGGRPAGATAAGGEAAVQPGVQIIRTVDVVIQVDQLATSSARVRAVAQSAGGAVASEVTTFPEAPAETVQGLARGGQPDGVATEEATRAATRIAQPGESVLVLRVPVAALDQTVERVTAVGTVLSRTASSQDVTADIADLDSRVKTQRASVERVRQLLAKATSLPDIVLLEAELSRRQADLEALQARLASVSDRAALSTLTVTLRTPQVAADDDDSGFIAGLERGWGAVIASTTVLLTVLGALLPLAVLVAILGVPAWWFVRRRRTARRTVPGPGPAPAPAPAPAPDPAGAAPPAPAPAGAPGPAPGPAAASTPPPPSGPSTPSGPPTR